MKLLGKAAHGTAVPAPDSAGGGAVQARGAYEVDGELCMALLVQAAALFRTAMFKGLAILP